MNLKYLTIETQRYVVYYEQDGVVHRDVFYNKDDIFSKYSSDEITEVNSNDPIILEFRSKLLSKQLQGLALNMSVIDANGNVEDINTYTAVSDDEDKLNENRNEFVSIKDFDTADENNEDENYF